MDVAWNMLMSKLMPYDPEKEMPLLLHSSVEECIQFNAGLANTPSSKGRGRASPCEKAADMPTKSINKLTINLFFILLSVKNKTLQR